MSQQSLPKKISFFISRHLMRFNFDSRKYWEKRYQSEWDSGAGSYGENSEAKALLMNDLVKELGITQVLEMGCGDGNQLQYYKIPEYIGLDVSNTTIKNCIEKYKNDSTKSFLFYDPMAFHNSGKIFNTQVAFSSDVLFHLVEEEIFVKYITDLFSFAREYVIIFASNHNENDDLHPHVYHRKFTNYVNDLFPEWELTDQRKCMMKSGEALNDWYIFSKK